MSELSFVLRQTKIIIVSYIFLLKYANCKLKIYNFWVMKVYQTYKHLIISNNRNYIEFTSISEHFKLIACSMNYCSKSDILTWYNFLIETYDKCRSFIIFQLFNRTSSNQAFLIILKFFLPDSKILFKLNESDPLFRHMWEATFLG